MVVDATVPPPFVFSVVRYIHVSVCWSPTRPRICRLRRPRTTNTGWQDHRIIQKR